MGGHRDRLFSQVPRSLPPWLDGPDIAAYAQKKGVSVKAAKRQLRLLHEKKKK